MNKNMPACEQDPEKFKYLIQVIKDLLVTQIILTKKSGGQLLNEGEFINTLPKKKFIYGYLTGFITCFLQITIFNDTASINKALLSFFHGFYGKKQAITIISNTQKYYKEGKLYKEGFETGYNESKELQEGPEDTLITGLAKYLESIEKK
ncbi:hypothetical protein N9560_00290 [Hyphomicrobiales bacterium]|jgi:hypothetical protein|nr:hypothetical protein [Rhodobiaceae bacterium]MDB4127875.1 hypothetical protein [Hyphomicrobiales bacterium]MDB4831359.1 hypothetical protein [Hyphomicrobiales bacterium]MDC0139834.1 hypothetical protein [Hyphomicrobiales bacterium]|tara:strand:- start:1732 stop:2181 length:450 start_codon:yes stop_codon:yes gene_type:complete